jgi:hypothetical protein
MGTRTLLGTTPDALIDDGVWRTYRYDFTPPLVPQFFGPGTFVPQHLMFEDTSLSGGVQVMSSLTMYVYLTHQNRHTLGHVYLLPPRYCGEGVKRPVMNRLRLGSTTGASIYPNLQSGEALHTRLP